MAKGITLFLSGDASVATGIALKERLLELGYRVEVIDARLAMRIGSVESRKLVCELLSRNGVIVLVSAEEVPQPDGRSLSMAVDANDTPEFAAEKALDLLAEAGAVQLESASYSPEEEERVRQRLADLGYVE